MKKPAANSVLDFTPEVLAQQAFIRMLALERKRAERSHRRLVLMLLDTGTLLKGTNARTIFEKILSAVLSSIRETDITGWYEDKALLGVIFTEIAEQQGGQAIGILREKVTNAIMNALGLEAAAEIKLSFHLHPEKSDSNRPEFLTSVFYPDLGRDESAMTSALRVKKAIDIAASAFGVLMCAPVFVLIALLIKLTSKGPVLFRQKRIGLHGKEFTFYKFRSMHAVNDHSIHKEYVTQLISSNAQSGVNQTPAYKLTNDPRITKVGRFLRKMSLDELPQLFNVLRGEMSLVGPRPPLPYEFAAYSAWHRNRLLKVKPGITGLWQVAGRSRVTFDEMVRLDLRYAYSWSLWLDITILLQTPRAVLSGEGAY